MQHISQFWLLLLVWTCSSHVHVTCQRIRSSMTECNLRHGSFYFPFRTRKMVHTLRASEAKDILFFESTRGVPILQHRMCACATKHLTNLANSNFGYSLANCQIAKLKLLPKFPVYGSLVLSIWLGCDCSNGRFLIRCCLSSV